jgi:hypothetical protein
MVRRDLADSREVVHSHGAQCIMEGTVDIFYTSLEDSSAGLFRENTSALAMGIKVGLKKKQVLICGGRVRYWPFFLNCKYLRRQKIRGKTRRSSSVGAS